MTKQTKLPESGKLPPQAPDLEEAVLGAMMLEKNAVNEAIEILKTESFYKEAHQRIFDAIVRLFAKNEPVDILTVSNELRSTGELDMCGGALYISQLTNKVASAANVQFHSRIIAQKYILRELISVGTDMIQGAFDDTTDVFDLLDQSEQNLFKISSKNTKKDFEKFDGLYMKALAQIEKAAKTPGHLSGVPSGFTKLDILTGGWQKQDLIILAARPGMGKTAAVLSMARNMAAAKIPVGIFSLEMSSLQLVNRLISGEAEVSTESLRSGNLRDEEFHKLHNRMSAVTGMPLYIDDTAALSVFEFRAKARRLVSQFGVQLIIVDYIQLMTAGDQKGNREQEISMISRSLKGVAKELDIPIIALSQLNRSVESRGGDKRPMLSDLRESGAIEQDADIVAFVYRPEYYGITAYENGDSAIGIGEIIFAKHRSGALDSVKLQYDATFTRFSNLPVYSYEPMKPNLSFTGEDNDNQPF